MHRYATAVLALLLIGTAGFSADNPPTVNADNGTWVLHFRDFFGTGKPLNLYPSRQGGKWIAAVGTSRLPNRNHHGWNVGKYVGDVNGVQVKGDAFRGTVKLTLTPDPWVPADHQPRSAVVEIEGKLGDPQAKGQVRSATGTYKARLAAGVRGTEAVEVQGTIDGGVEPTKIGELDNVTYILVFHDLLPGGGKEADQQRRLWIGIGLKKGAIVSAQAATIDLKHKPNDIRFIDRPADLHVSKDGVHGKLMVPFTALDATPVQIEIALQGGRVQGYLSGTYTATVKKSDGAVEKRANCFDGIVSVGAVEGPAVVSREGHEYAVPVKDFKVVQPGEHPRLLFRKCDLPKLRERAQTPEGKAILARLRKCLNGSDGESMPTSFNPEKGPVQSDGAGTFGAKAPLGTYTFSHMAGFGLLYQLTGDKKYAELGKQCFEKAQEGYRDRDRRYAFKAPYGTLRAGPVLGWTALGYDLCYDGWDEAFRKKVAAALVEYEEPGKTKLNLSALARGTMPPGSNHFGMQVGGAALALLAISRDPGVDQKKIDALLAINRKGLERNLTGGFGDGGFFAEGDGPGSMSSHIIFTTALQAWRVAGGQDFVSPRPNASWTALKWIFLTVPRGGQMDFWPKRGGYTHNVWSRGGLSGAGYFAFSFGTLADEHKSAMLWFYNHHLKEQDATNGTPFDTTNPYPHLAVCSYVNWPLGLAEKNPADVLPHCYRDSTWGFYAFRNRWQDENDIVISVLTKEARGYIQARADGGPQVAAFGKKFKWGTVRGEVKRWRPARDGSGVLTLQDGTSLAVDFSKASGADAMLVTTGAADGIPVTLGGTKLTFKFLTAGAEPKPEVKGDRVIVGEQTVMILDGGIVLGKMAEPPVQGRAK